MEETKKDKSDFDWNEIAKKGAQDKRIQKEIGDFEEYCFKYLEKQKITSIAQEVLQPKWDVLEEKAGEIHKNYPDITPKDFKRRILQAFERVKERVGLHLIKKAKCEITFDGFGIYKFFEAVASFIDELQFSVREDALYLHTMDASRIGLMEIKFFNESFKFFKTGKLGINIEDLKILTQCQAGDQAETRIIIGEDRLFLEIKSKYNPKLDRDLIALDIEVEEIPMDNLNAIVYPHIFEIPKDKYEYLMRNFGKYSEILDIECNNDAVTFSESGQIGQQQMSWTKKQLPRIEHIRETLQYEIKKLNKEIDNLQESLSDEEIDSEQIEEELKERAVRRSNLLQLKNEVGRLRALLDIKSSKGSYSLTFLNINKKMTSVLTPNEVLRFSLNTDHPLRTEIDFKRLGDVHLIYYLAARCEEAEFDMDDMDEY